ncbi:MAG: arylesterase [Pararhizobium sp.]
MRFKAPVTLLLSLLAAALFALPAAARPFTIVGLGDSLMAGYRLPASDDFTGQLQAALKAKGYDVAVTDAGVSGDTTSDGLARIDWSVPDGTDAVLLELGGNDALRGIPPEKTRKNLQAMVSRLKQRGIAVLMIGILAPPNMGEAYANAFDPIFKEIAEENHLVFYPFFLDGVATHPGLQLDDGIHPNAKGVAVMVKRFLPYAERLIDGAKASAENR